MLTVFCDNLASLRRHKKVNQREAAQALGVSQALLSHYEKGLREPGLSFLVRAAEYYGVTADYLLGRTEDPSGAAVDREALFAALSEENESIRAGAQTRLDQLAITDTVGILYDILTRIDDLRLARLYTEYLAYTLYMLFGPLYDINGKGYKELFCLSGETAEAAQGAQKLCVVQLLRAIKAKAAANGIPEISAEALFRDYPVRAQSLTALLNQVGEKLRLLIKED